MRELNVSLITETIERLCIEACNHLPEDVKRGIRTCRVCEDGEIAKGILDNIITNFDIADAENVPVCQDTGMACVFLEIGQDVHLVGACPPIVVGVGIGGTFDKAALLSKKALMRPIDSSHPDPFYADLEREMLEKINQLGIGPQGFGGRTTALGVNIETLPTHIAGMPCAVNISCHVTRHKTEVL